MTTPFVHRIRIRYGEVDVQAVAFNAHYLAYCDDAIDGWFEHLGFVLDQSGWDFMVKRAQLEWQGSARHRDLLDIEVAVTRWGTTSFDVGFRGSVGETPVFTATITYVGVRPGTLEPAAPPVQVRALLSS